MLMIRNKPQVFISSLCAKYNDPKTEKYGYIRSYLKDLLESTGMFTAYVYEEEGAVAVNALEAYEREIPRSQIIIILLDNADDDRAEAVYKEERMAREEGLRMLYVFCDETIKAETKMQKSLKLNNRNKYSVVHSFKEMPNEAFNSLMNDILTGYVSSRYSKYQEHSKKWEDTVGTPTFLGKSVLSDNIQLSQLSDTEKTEAVELYVEVPTVKNSETEVNYSVRKEGRDCSDLWFVKKSELDVGRCLIECIKAIYDSKLSRTVTNERSFDASKIDEMRNNILLCVLRMKREEGNSFDYILKDILYSIGTKKYKNENGENESCSIQAGAISNVQQKIKKYLSEKYEGLKAFYNDDTKSMVTHFKDAFHVITRSGDDSSNTSDCYIPDWIKLDAAIDYRNAEQIHRDVVQDFTPTEEGQNYINKSDVRYVYPEINRVDGEIISAIQKWYTTPFFESPYKIKLGSNLDEICTNIVRHLQIALRFGSFTQLEMTRGLVIKLLEMFFVRFADRKPALELVRLLIADGRSIKDVKLYNSSYKSGADMMNNEEASEMLHSFDNLPLKGQRSTATRTFVVCFGHYLHDDDYNTVVDSIIEETMQWAKDKDRSILNTDSIIEFYKVLCERERGGDSVRFAMTLMDNSPKSIGWTNEVFNVLLAVDFCTLSEELQEELGILLKNELSEELLRVGQASNTYIQAVLDSSIIENILVDDLKLKVSSFYKDVYLLEKAVLEGDADIIEQGLRSFISQEKMDNVQSNTGLYTGLADRNISNMYNVIRNARCRLSDGVINEMVDSLLTLIANPSRLVSSKIAACRLMVFLVLNYGECLKLEYLYEQLGENRDENIKVFENYMEKGSVADLLFVYNLMLYVIGETGKPMVDYLIDDLFTLSVDMDDRYEAIQTLQTICDILRADNENKLTAKILNPFLHFVLSMAGSRDRNVRFYSVECLVEMTAYTQVKSVATRRLARFMDGGQPDIRVAIVSRIHKIHANRDPYLELIKAKGRMDHYYLVRKALLMRETDD